MIFEMRTYDQGYRERVVSRANASLLLRMVLPSDKERVMAGSEDVSGKSRHTRFFIHENGLTEEELRLFTETDGFDHFAMGAVELEAGEREGRGVAIARFARYKDESDTAEVALTVIGEMRGQGIGRMLLERLVEAARERGVSRLRFLLLADNERAHTRISKVCPAIELSKGDGVIVAETNLESTGGIEGLWEMLKLVASRAVLTPPEAAMQGAEPTLEA